MLEIRQLEPDDDLEAEIDLARRAFGPAPQRGQAFWLAEARETTADGRYFAAFDGPQPVGMALYHDMRQWWHGRAVPMAGVGGVKVAPEQRGRGTGRALMTELLRVISDRGYPLSVLYPATAPLYRSLGWELAGGLYRGVIRARSIASLLPPDDPAQPLRDLPSLRRAEPGDAEEVVAVLGAVHQAARHCGPATFDAATVRRWWLTDENLFCYLADDGFLAYGWNEADHHELSVRVALAGSPETTRALWSIVGSHAPLAKQVRTVMSLDDPLAWLTREPDLGLASRWQWMLRVVDAPAAIAGRGFPAAAGVAAELQIEDTQLPGNAGRWMLEVSEGKGALTRRHPAGSATPVRLGARGFAALYGGVPMATLRRAGLAAGGDTGADEALDAAFAGKAFLLDSF